MSLNGHPFGTSFLPELQMGVPLGEHGYVEEEHLFEGHASVWRRGQNGEPETVRADVPFSTRVLVRRPADVAEASGLVVVEPLHPDLDSAIVWDAVHPWLLRGGHTWTGVTVFAACADQLRDVLDPTRYGGLDIPEDGQQYDVLVSAVEALVSGRLGQVRADRVILAGMSATGSLCRVVLQDGFDRRAARPDGSPLVDGFVLAISSGGAGAAGYPPLSPHDSELAPTEPRRTVSGRGAIVFEVLSETEAETHEHVTRPDSDDHDDRYRLYEVAGTAHIEARPSVLTNLVQFERVGGTRPAFDVREQRSDARFDVYLRGAVEAMWRWLVEDTPAPRAARLQHRSGAEELLRDPDGNALGGIRPPWVQVPAASYAPHSTASSDSEPPPPWMPFSRPDMLARLVGSMRPLPMAELRRRYGTRAEYLDRFAAAVRHEVEGGLLLADEARELLRDAPSRWRG